MPPQSHPRTVLLVDDDRMLLDAVTRVMQQEGFRVETATNAAAAIKALHSTPVDLVVSDLCMPRMDGLELLDALSHGAAACPTPFILVSGSMGDEERRRAAELGADACLEKPFDLTRLSQIARSVTRFREAKAAQVKDHGRAPWEKTAPPPPAQIPPPPWERK